MTAVVDKKLMANARLTALFDEGTLKYVASQVDGIGAVSALAKSMAEPLSPLQTTRHFKVAHLARLKAQ